MVPAVWVFVLVLVTADRKMLLRAACATAVMALVCELRQFFVFRDLRRAQSLIRKWDPDHMRGCILAKKRQTR